MCDALTCTNEATHWSIIQMAPKFHLLAINTCEEHRITGENGQRFVAVSSEPLESADV